MAEQAREQTLKEKIIGLLKKGYSRSQLIADFGFAERTVDGAIKEYREMKDDEPGEPPKANGCEARGPDLPGATRRDAALIRRQTEAVLPEWLQAEVAELFDGSTEQKRVFLAGMAIPLMGLRLFSEAVGPLVELMATWQKGQAEAVLAAQGAGAEVAQQAAHQALSGAMPQILEAVRMQAVAQSPNPMQAMLAESLRPYLMQLMGNLMGAATGGTLAGAPQTPLGQASHPGTQQATKEEVEAAFGN